VKKIYKLIILFLVVTTACVTPIEVVIDEEINVLVIDGYITTDTGPHEIRITRSAKFGDIFVGTIELISKASVSVRDQTGTVTKLVEDRPGFYFTPAEFKGEVGYSYTLLVETIAGESYSSFPQKIAPAPAIQDVFFQFKNTPTVDPTVTNSGLDVMIQFDDPGDERNFYMWEVDGVYEQTTNPELFVNLETDQLAPKSCCSVCYISDNGVANDILSDIQVNGNTIVQKIGFLKDDRRRFQSDYMIHIRQFSITEDAYEFFRVLRNQLEISGSIFDPPPATIGSNIINLNDPDAATIGYFGAFDVQNYDAFIDLTQITEPRTDQVANDDCRLLQKSTVVRPADWD
jgi:uncharacterized protein DUF4249